MPIHQEAIIDAAPERIYAVLTDGAKLWRNVSPRVLSACTWGMNATRSRDRSSVSTNTMFGRRTFEPGA